MNPRYQVFVSSTLTDLKDERQMVMKALMKMDCIPAGMEFFNAVDEEQMKFIESIIDDSDYYVLIVGARYGTLTSEGVSFTEREYDYAVSKKVPVIACIHATPASLSFEKSEATPELRAKLEQFRIKVSKGRLVQFWDDSKLLPSEIAFALMSAFKSHPRPGWVRGGSVSNPELLSQINELRQRNEALEKEIAKARPDTGGISLNLTSANSKFQASGSYYRSNTKLVWTCEMSWNEIIGAIGPKLFSPLTDAFMRTKIGNTICDYTNNPAKKYTCSIDDTVFETIKIQLIALGYIRVERSVWNLTDLGKQTVFQVRAIQEQASVV